MEKSSRGLVAAEPDRRRGLPGHDSGSQPLRRRPADTDLGRRGGTRSGSIRLAWRRMVVLYVAIVVAMGFGTLAFTRFQRDVFDDTTSRLEAEVGELAQVAREVLASEVPLGGVLYELSRTADLDQQWGQFQDYNTEIEAGFSRLQMLPDGAASEALVRAENGWRTVVKEVAAAKQLWGTGVVAEALARGEDPFGATVWAPLTETEQALADALAASSQRVRTYADEADRRQAMVQPVVLGAAVFALALGLVSGWRLSRRVVRPLSMLRLAAARMRDGNLGEPVPVPHCASSEVTELAETMNEMAAVLSQTQGRLRTQVYTDALTGLPNRKAITELLDETFSMATDYQLAVLMIDVDDFKFVNDSMGHAAGDTVLSAVAGRLRAAVRGNDMVARLGGDEFAVVVQAHDAASTAAVVAERILSSLQQTIAVGETAVQIDCSIGIAVGAPQSASAEELLRNADIAMYTAKSRGKHCFELFDRSMHRSMLSHIELKEDLARAVERDELELHYQPIIDLASRTVLGFEALVRWRHPTRGLLPPPEFIGLAEETGDIVAIGGWVINQACQDLARFRATSGQPKLWMAVNVSARQLMADALNEVVREALHRHDIDGASLILEITEQAVITDTERACRILTQLRAEGVKKSRSTTSGPGSRRSAHFEPFPSTSSRSIVPSSPTMGSTPIPPSCSRPS